MATNIDQSLQTMSKKYMIPIALSLQSKLDQANKKVLEEIRKLNDAFSKSEYESSVTKQVNPLLSRRFVNMGCQCWFNAQYSRQECLEIIGISSEVEADVLEEEVVNIFDKSACNIPPNCIEACHSVSKKSVSKF